MTRSLLTLVYALAVLAAAPAVAQPRATQVPVAVGGATPGISIQFFMDANKLADTTASGTGGVNWVLDLGNMPKTKLTIYVDVCKDGKIVKVMFVSGNGEAPPKDDDCNRRLAALSFQSDCAGVHVNLDFSNFAASNVIGCGISFTSPKVLGTVGGVLVGAVALTAGGGGSTTTPTASSPPSLTSTTTTTAAPPAAPPTSTTPPAAPPSTTPAPPSTPPPTTPAPSDFSVTVTLSYEHISSNQSVVCGVIVTNPPQPGGQFSVQVAGFGVITAQSTATGTLNSSGRGTFRVPILLLGTYNAAGTAAANSMTKPFNGSINVTQASNSCPQS